MDLSSEHGVVVRHRRTLGVIGQRVAWLQHQPGTRHSIAACLASVVCASCVSAEAVVEVPYFSCTPVRFGDVPIGECVAREVECPWPLGAVATALEVVPPDPSVTSDLSARAVRGRAAARSGWSATGS